MKRAFHLIVDDLEIASQSVDLFVDFSIEKDLTNSPNKATIKVANLTEEHYSTIQSGETIQFDAGNDNTIGTLFLGEIESVTTAPESRSIITEITASDSGRSYRNAIMSYSFASNILVLDVFRYAVGLLAIGEGNLSSFADRITLRNSQVEYSHGVSLRLPAREYVRQIVASSGLRHSVIDGVLQLREPGRAVSVDAVLLNSETGMIGSPARGKTVRRGRAPEVTATSLLNPGLYPGRSVRLQSRFFNADYVAQSVKHYGATTGNPWYTDLTLREIV